jgi:glycerol-3-phosphate cytidylyltransferase-like family protein
MTDDERFQMVTACKWVDLVVRDVPYVLDQKYLDEVSAGNYINVLLALEGTAQQKNVQTCCSALKVCQSDQ